MRYLILFLFVSCSSLYIDSAMFQAEKDMNCSLDKDLKVQQLFGGNSLYKRYSARGCGKYYTYTCTKDAETNLVSCVQDK